MCALKSRMLLVMSNTSVGVCVPLLTMFGGRSFVQSFAHGPFICNLTYFV